MSDQTCKFCKWWIADDREAHGLRVCRRMPPTASVSAHGTIFRRFPVTYNNDYCGEFAPPKAGEKP